MLALAGEIVSETDTGAEVLVVVMRQAADIGIGERAVEGNQFLIGPAVLDVRRADHVVVLVPAQAQVQGQTARHFPVVLKVEPKLLGGDQEVGIAVGLRHADHGTRGGEFLRIVLRVVQNHARVGGEVDFQRRAELEETALPPDCG